MPRSSYIYIVSRTCGFGVTVAAFSVKHELVSWLKRQERPSDSFAVFRVTDGTARSGDWLDIEELLK